MHVKTTLLLAIALGIVLGVIWIVDWHAPEREHVPVRAERLLAFEPEKIQTLSVTWDDQTVECTNDHGVWWLRRPVSARADADRLHRWLGLAENLPLKERISPAERRARDLDWADFGLAQPRARLVFAGEGRLHEIAIGDPSPLRESVFVRVDRQESVAVTASNIVDLIPAHPNDLRDPHLLEGHPADVTRLEIKRRDGPLLHLQREDNEWILRKPLMARADEHKVGRLLEHLFALRARQFVSETLADPVAYGLHDDDALLSVAVTRGEQGAVTRWVFGKDADPRGACVYAAARGAASVYTVEREAIERVAVSVDDVRDPCLYFLPRSRIRWLRVEEGVRVLQAQRGDGAEWRMDLPRQAVADTRAVMDLIVRLNALPVEPAEPAAADEAAAALAHPARVVRMADFVPALVSGDTPEGARAEPSAGQTLRALRVSTTQPGKEYVFAQFDDDPHPYRLSASAAATIVWDPLAYCDTTVLRVEAAHVRSVTVRRDAVEQTVECDAAGAWRAVTPSNAVPDVARIRALLERVKAVKAVRFAERGGPDVARFGLHTPARTVTFRLSGEGGIQKSLWLGEATDDQGVFAMIQGQEDVFVLTKDEADALLLDVMQ